MIISNIPKPLADLYKSLLAEFKPKWKVEIITEDYNLYRLGFVDEIPCSLSLDVSYEEIYELQEEIEDMEIEVYYNEDLLYKELRYMTEEEKNTYKELKKKEKNYEKYAPLEAIYNYWLAQQT